MPGYEVLGALGRGGMGVVFAARQSSLGRRVALKFLPPAATTDAESLRRFHHEARTASSVNHPHICTIFDLGTHAGQPFIVMELIVGRTLAVFLDDRPPIEEVARAEVAKALKLQPDMTLAKWRSANFYRDPAILTAQLADLAAAGLP